MEQKIDNRILNIDGWMSPKELNWLFEITLQIPKDGLIVEIGAWKGRSTAILYTAAGDNKAVVTIDTWLGEPALRTTVYREATETNVFCMFMDNMAVFGVMPRWYKKGSMGAQYLLMDSVESASLFDNDSVDMLFIDGDHLRAGEDIDAWDSKVKVGGIISGHDWQIDYVKDAVSKRFTVDKIVETIWIKTKNEG